MNHTYCVIMAGGRGERFWPLSTPGFPKPFLPLTGKKSLIQLTIDRALKLVPKDRIIIILGERHYTIARKQLNVLSKDNFILEPEGRDTAPCIGYTAISLLKRDSEAVMIVLPADHYIPYAHHFIRTISQGVEVAKNNECLITIGVKPTRPETGYGYIKISSERLPASPGITCYKVKQFIEKPEIKKACIYAKNACYFWNAGIFVWKASVILDAISHYMPDLYKGLHKMPMAKTGIIIDRRYKKLPKISIDYGVMEKSDKVFMIPALFQWDDVGTWSAFKRLSKDENYIQGKRVICIDTKDCVIYGDIRVGTIGISNLIVVATKNGVLICDMNEAQKVKEIAKKFERQR